MCISDYCCSTFCLIRAYPRALIIRPKVNTEFYHQWKEADFSLHRCSGRSEHCIWSRGIFLVPQGEVGTVGASCAGHSEEGEELHAF